MKLIVTEDKIICTWEYTIRRMEKIVDDKKYFHYSCAFPTELKELWDDTDFVFFSENEKTGRRFVLSPIASEDAKKIKISRSGKESWSFSIPKKFVHDLDDKSVVKICFDGSRAVLSCF